MAIEIIPIGNRSVEYNREVLKNALRGFLAKNNLEAVLAISGTSNPQEVEKTIEIITSLIENLDGLPVAILTGGTKDGVPEIGLRIAKSRSIPTIGVFPEHGRRYALYDQMDLAIEVLPPSFGSSTFGTETPTFVNLTDGVVVIGGGFGTLTEVATLLKINNSRIKKGLRPKYVCPIKNTGGVADIIETLPGIISVGACLPPFPINNGKEAAKFLRSRLTAQTLETIFI